MFLAGDNVYDVSTEDENKEGKRYDMNLQISKGFENCFRKANIDRFYIGIGNHDIEYCDVLNIQKNYEGWNFPSLYYNVIYNMKNFIINVILIDTNILEDEPIYCDNIPYKETELKDQLNWAKEISSYGDWKIVIGHIPYIANGHKTKRPNVYNKGVEKILDIIKPHIYICADEHNAQALYIDKKKLLCLVAGSGGTNLDNFVEPPNPNTIFRSKTFGFLSLNIEKDILTSKFISNTLNIPFSISIDRDGELMKSYV